MKSVMSEKRNCLIFQFHNKHINLYLPVKFIFIFTDKMDIEFNQ